jgi:hypothetical protein
LFIKTKYYKSNAMPAQDILFTLICSRDVARLNAGLRSLLSYSAGAEVVLQHWIELLLTWHMAGAFVDPPCAERLLGVLKEEQLLAMAGTLYERFLPDIANSVLGVDAFERTAEANLPMSFTYTPIARALAFGVCEQDWLPPRVRCARDACYLIHRLEYIEAIHALCCLDAASRHQRGKPYWNQVESFSKQAHGYLAWSAAAMGAPRLNWEIQVWNSVQSRAKE